MFYDGKYNNIVRWCMSFPCACIECVTDYKKICLAKNFVVVHRYLHETNKKNQKIRSMFFRYTYTCINTQNTTYILHTLYTCYGLCAR